MPRQARAKNVSSADGEPAAEETTNAPSVEERKGMRAHSEVGQVRPADGRWELHEPKHESKFVRTDLGTEKGNG